MSDNNLDREIEEGLARSEKMLRWQKIIRIGLALLGFLAILIFLIVFGSIAYWFGPSSVPAVVIATLEQQELVATVTPLPSMAPSPRPIDTAKPELTATEISVDTLVPTSTLIPTLEIKPTDISTSISDAPCVNISGLWNGSASNKKERFPYSLSLIQTGCEVSGSSDTRNIGPSFIKGKVSFDKFYFTEYGDPGFCYFSGTLTIKGNEMQGADVNCQEWIFLIKKLDD